MDLSKYKCTFYDTGMSGAIAECLSREFGAVWHFTPFLTAFPKIRDFAKGYGLGKVKKTRKFSYKGEVFEEPVKFWDCAKRSDLIVLPDVGFGDIAQHIREVWPKKRVIGSNGGDVLEENRYLFRLMQKEAGLPIPQTERVFGTCDLMEYLDTHSDVYVKMAFRGDQETFHALSRKKAETRIDEINYKYGPFKHLMPFVVEKPVKDGIVESGVELFCYGKGLAKPYIWSVERGAPYVAKFCNELPPFAARTMKGLLPLLQKLNYRGPFSTEEIVTAPDRSVMIDATCRFAQPLSSSFPESITNLPEVMWRIGGGEKVILKPRAEYFGCLPLNTGKTLESWAEVNFDPEYERVLKPVFGCKVDGQRYAVPGFETVVNLVAWGKTAEQVVDRLKRLLDKVDVDELEKESSELDNILKDFKEMRKMGLKI